MRVVEHIRRVHPRSAFGASMAGSSTVAGSPAEVYRTDASRPRGTPVSDTEEPGVIFMALNAGLSRQF